MAIRDNHRLVEFWKEKMREKWDMVRWVVKSVVCAVAAVGMLWGSPILAQGINEKIEAEFESQYGGGVHRFFNQQVAESIDFFSRAIDTGFPDARPFYFRGLARERLGQDGRADFEQGAKVEMLGGGSTRLVNIALERIQGPDRLTIEKIRSETKERAIAGDFLGIRVLDIKTGLLTREIQAQPALKDVAPGQRQPGSVQSAVRHEE